ncbi:MAG: AMP-binding protein [Aggregatilineales bacterium]
MILTRKTDSDIKTLVDVIDGMTADTRPAIIYLQTGHDPITITRSEFRYQVQSCAAALQKDAKIGENDLVIVAHTQNIEGMVMFWAAMQIGAIPSLFPTLTEKLDPDIYMSHMAQLVEISDVKAILTSDDFVSQLDPYVSCPVYGTSEVNTAPEIDTESTLLPYPPAPEKIAFLQHSSGTTGLQKGVALSHQAVLAHLASYSDALKLTEDDVIVSWLPLYHDMGLIAGFLLPLVQGIPLVLMSPFDWVSKPAMLMRAIHDYQGTLCWLPNFAYNHCARRIRQGDLTDDLNLSSIRAFINCSEPARVDSHQKFLDRFAAYGLKPEMLGVSYAMAENTFAVTQTPIGQAAATDSVNRSNLTQHLKATPAPPTVETSVTFISCGTPIAGVQIEVVDADGNTLPERHIGEFKIISDSLLTGYYKRDDLKPLDADGWYLTGDRGYIAEGEIYVIGRSKDLIINAGKNVYPQDIEAVVNQVDGVHPGRAVAFGVHDERDGTELIGVVAEVDTDHPDEIKRIKREIRQKVVSHTEVSVSYVTPVASGWLIKTSSGKIARAANRDKWLAERQS